MIKTSLIQLPSIQLNVAQAGPDEGPVVILLHGFPDAWFGWKHQITALAEQGYRVLAPDQRGYNLSEKPQAIHAYSLPVLANDVIELANYFQVQTFFLAGHDFGGMVAWTIADLFPERIKKLIILSAPHLKASLEYNKTHWQQKFKSWYILFFQIKRVPEFLLKRFNYALLMRNMPANMNKKEKQQYLKAWRQVGALKAMLYWYKALVSDLRNKRLKGSTISPPTLILWGKKDKYLQTALAGLSHKQCQFGQIHIFEQSGHWLMHEAAAVVFQRMHQFLRESNI